MPGYKASVERTKLVIVRVSPEEYERWKAWGEQIGVYRSELVRVAVKEFMKRHPNAKHVGHKFHAPWTRLGS